MLTRVDFPSHGLVAFLSLERRNAIVIEDTWHRAGPLKGRTLGAVTFAINGQITSGLWEVNAKLVPFPQPAPEPGIFAEREQKAQRKAIRKARKRVNRTNRIDDNIVYTLKTVFTQQLLATQ